MSLCTAQIWLGGAQAARARAVAMRAQREAAAEEADRVRREAAQAKLAELEQRIARR